jgi:hypothetical protein
MRDKGAAIRIATSCVKAGEALRRKANDESVGSAENVRNGTGRNDES